MLEHLLSPFRVGSMELRNRIAMAPMGVEIVEGDGKVREPVVRYYEERARGGVGLLISENTEKNCLSRMSFSLPPRSRASSFGNGRWPI